MVKRLGFIEDLTVGSYNRSDSTIEKILKKEYEKVIETKSSHYRDKLPHESPKKPKIDFVVLQPIKIKAQDKIIEDKLDSNIKFRHDKDYDYFQDLEVQMDKMKILESEIPLSVLYNPQIERIKREDRYQEDQNIRPIVFNYKYDNEKKNIVGVKIQVMGEDLETAEALIKKQENQDKMIESFFRRGTVLIKQNRFNLNFDPINKGSQILNIKNLTNKSKIIKKKNKTDLIDVIISPMSKKSRGVNSPNSIALSPTQHKNLTSTFNKQHFPKTTQNSPRQKQQNFQNRNNLILSGFYDEQKKNDMNNTIDVTQIQQKAYNLKNIDIMGRLNKSRQIFGKWYLKPDQLSNICKNQIQDKNSLIPINTNKTIQMQNISNMLDLGKIQERTVRKIVEDIKENVIKIRNKNKI
eukprot:403351229